MESVAVWVTVGAFHSMGTKPGLRRATAWKMRNFLVSRRTAGDASSSAIARTNTSTISSGISKFSKANTHRIVTKTHRWNNKFWNIRILLHSLWRKFFPYFFVINCFRMKLDNEFYMCNEITRYTLWNYNYFIILQIIHTDWSNH